MRVTFVGDDEVLLDVDGGSGPTSSARLERFRIRVKADIEALDWRAIAVRGDAPRAATDGRASSSAPAWWGSACGLRPARRRPGATGRGAEADPAALEAARIEAGWPAMGAEITDQTIPASSARS